MATPYRPSRISPKTGHALQQLMDEAAAGGVAWDDFNDFDTSELPDDLLNESNEYQSKLPYSPSRLRDFPPTRRYSLQSPNNGGEYRAYSPVLPGYSASSGTYNPTSLAYNPTSPTYNPKSPFYSPNSPSYDYDGSYSPPAAEYSSISRHGTSHSALKSSRSKNVADFLAKSHAFAPNRGPATNYTPSAYKPVFRKVSASPSRMSSTSPAPSKKRASRWDQRPESDLNQTAMDQALIEGLMHENEELQREIKRMSPTKNAHEVLDLNFDDTAEPLGLGEPTDEEYAQAFDDVFGRDLNDGGIVDDLVFDKPAVCSPIKENKVAPKEKAASPKRKASPSSSRASAGMRRSSRFRNKAVRK